MKRLVVALVFLLPAVAQAQPGPYPPPPPGGDPNQPPPPDGYSQPAPPAGYAPQPVYGQPVYQPQPQPAASLRNGMTLELNLGFGMVWARSEGQDSETETALAGLNLGIGGWLNERMALTGRVSGTTFSPQDGVRFTTGVIGPSLQYWTDDHIWVGGGVGLAFAAISVDGANEQPDPETGFGLDLRAGYTFSTGTVNTFNVSVEYNPGFFSFDGGSVQLNSFGLLFGYQHL